MLSSGNYLDFVETQASIKPLLPNKRGEPFIAFTKAHLRDVSACTAGRPLRVQPGGRLHRFSTDPKRGGNCGEAFVPRADDADAKPVITQTLRVRIRWHRNRRTSERSFSPDHDSRISNYDCIG
jgi:hypothetical protein